VTLIAKFESFPLAGHGGVANRARFTVPTAALTRVSHFLIIRPGRPESERRNLWCGLSPNLDRCQCRLKADPLSHEIWSDRLSDDDRVVRDAIEYRQGEHACRWRRCAHGGNARQNPAPLDHPRTSTARATGSRTSARRACWGSKEEVVTVWTSARVALTHNDIFTSISLFSFRNRP
jgi:hypothetical protein